MSRHILVAGLGNIFLSDDAFGVAVAQRLAEVPRPDTVRVTDYGIRGVHLAYDLMPGFDTVILVDVVRRGDPPGTVTLLDLTATAREAAQTSAPVLLDPHGMQPNRVLELLAACGASPRRVLLVGCEPQSLEEAMGLTPVVQAAVAAAADLVCELWKEEGGEWDEKDPDWSGAGGDSRGRDHVVA